jgi:hypothetical protein
MTNPFLSRFKQICHPHRSVAEWSGLRLFQAGGKQAKPLVRNHLIKVYGTCFQQLVPPKIPANLRAADLGKARYSLDGKSHDLTRAWQKSTHKQAVLRRTRKKIRTN